MNIQEIENRIGYTFTDKALLKTAFTHSSYAQYQPNNERLEFLGDAVLELVISAFLYKELSLSEGRMTRLRANIVCTESLARAAARLGFGNELRMGKGELCTGGRTRRSNLANVFEALMGGIFLDAGYEQARDVALSLLGENIDLALQGKLVKDYKTELQERVQQHPGHTIEYADLDVSGPEHAQIFTAELRIDGAPVATGSGKTKKEAQQEAAKACLKDFDA